MIAGTNKVFSNDHVETMVEVVGVSSFPAELGAGWGIYGTDAPPFKAARDCHAFVIGWHNVSISVALPLPLPLPRKSMRNGKSDEVGRFSRKERVTDTKPYRN